MKNVARNLFLIVIGIYLTGCGSTFQLRDASHDLVNLLNAKKNAEDFFQEKENVSAALETLAIDSGNEAEKQNTKILNKIAFYRIAATAAWQAKKKKMSNGKNVLDYTKAGSALCQDPNIAPRDCGMFMVFPSLASIDELKGTLESLSIRAGESNKPTSEELVDLFNSEKFELEKLITSRAIIKNTKIHPEFIDELDKQMGKIYCQHISNSKGLIRQVLTSSNDNYKKVACDAYDLETKLRALKLYDTMKKCASPRPPTKPSGCS